MRLKTYCYAGIRAISKYFLPIGSRWDDDFDKAIEGAVMFAVNQGEVCTCPSPFYTKVFMINLWGKVVERTKAIMGNPLDSSMIVQASNET